MIQFTLPWDKKPAASTAVYATVGAVACYKVKFQKDEDEWQFTQFWVKGYAVQTGSLHYSDKEDTLYIGFDDGSVQRLKIADNGLSAEVSFFTYISFR